MSEFEFEFDDDYFDIDFFENEEIFVFFFEIDEIFFDNEFEIEFVDFIKCIVVVNFDWDNM